MFVGRVLISADDYQVLRVVSLQIIRILASVLRVYCPTVVVFGKSSSVTDNAHLVEGVSSQTDREENFRRRST